MTTDVFHDRARRVVVALAVLSLFATVVAMVFGDKLAGAPPTSRDSFTYGPLGHRAFYETLSRLGVRVRRHQSGDERAVAETMLFLEPDDTSVSFGSSKLELREILEARKARGYLSIVALPKWRLDAFGVARPEDAELVREVLDATAVGGTIAHHGTPDARPDEEEAWTGEGETRVTYRVSVPWPQTLMPTGGWISGPHGTIVTCEEDSGLVCVIADPDLLHNFDIHRAEHAKLLATLLEGDRVVVVDEIFHGHRIGKSITRALGEWPGVLVLVHGLLVAVVVLLMGRRRFGVPEEPAATHIRGPREVIDVTANVLAVGETKGRLALAYVEHVLLDLHQRLGLPEVQGVDARAKALDQLAARRRIRPEAEPLLAEARLTSTRRDAPFFAMARRAYHFRYRLLGRAEPKPTTAPVRKEDR